MRVRLLCAVLLLVPLAASAAPRQVSLVMYPGQSMTYAASAALLTVRPAAASKAVSFTFDQYGTRVQLLAREAGRITLLCEHADNQIGEVLNVVVVARKLHDDHARAANSLRGIEGLRAEDVLVGDVVYVTGELYSQADLDRCLTLERNSSTIVCAARLSSAAVVVAPALGYTARANMEVRPETQSSGDAQWLVTVRLGDIPVFSAVSANREKIVTTAGRLTRKLNAMISAWRTQSEQKGAMFPVSFRSRAAEDKYELVASWSLRHGSSGDLLTAAPLEEIAPVATAAGATPDRLVQWWMALLGDAFRLYYMAERPVRGGTASESPLLKLYENALRLRRAQLDPYTAPPAVARAYFAMRLASASDPLETLLTTPPSDVVGAIP
ncbi:MAG TPA: hypothetical protein VEK11_21580 [Thermoanaerobaculia bacterium]|nr:hypothetical protein [Thermoanaerobaculia bacterium]